jgi:tight junction protein 1
MLVQFKPDEYDGVKQNGDSFYIKTHFNYEQPRKNECSFKRGEIFHVTDTLHNGTVGSWQVYRVSRSGQDAEKGVIPNKTHAEEFALRDVTKKEGNEVTKTGSFFRRRKPGGSGRRSKSLNYEEIYSETIKFPAYEKVVLKHPGFVRPVVLFGPVADIARERLLRDYPEKFAVPSTAGDSTDTSGPRPIRLSGIKQIIDQNKHALIDITPHGVERLVFAQLYPIVLFLKADSKQAVKEIRNGVINNKQQSSLSLLR